MYAIYNHTTGKYGIIYHNLTVARSMAHAYSAMLHNDRTVVDLATGEVMAVYENGNETYKAMA